MKRWINQNTSKNPKPRLPADEYIAQLSNLLLKQQAQTNREARYAPVKEVLALLGRGAILSAAILAPKTASFLLPLVKEASDWNAWQHYNISYLQRTLRRLERQKQVETTEENGQQVVKLTQNGKRKILRFNLDNLKVTKPKTWDGSWRLVLYDVPLHQHALGELVRQALRALGFYPIQKSVYLFPYPCFEQIEFLREYYGLGNSLQYMLVTKVEHDDAYKNYFALS